MAATHRIDWSGTDLAPRKQAHSLLPVSDSSPAADILPIFDRIPKRNPTTEPADG
jgi:hypothetical protein